MQEAPFYAYLRRHKVGINATLIAVLQVLSVPIWVLTAYSTSWWSLFLSLVASSALYLRYSYARASIVTVVLCLAGTLLLPVPSIAVWWVAPIATYHVARHSNRRARILILVLGLVGAALAGASVSRSAMTDYSWTTLGGLVSFFGVTFLCAAIILAAWLLGDARRFRFALQQQLLERAQRLEFESDQERKLAAQDERARIAREMHDIVAHSLSVIIMQSDGARYSLQTQKSLDAAQKVGGSTLTTISDTARHSLQQMRQLLGVLRTDEDVAYTPAPGLADIPSLLAGFESAGLPLQVVNTSMGGLNLPPGAELTAFRIVQEALTNVTKHARSAQEVQVEIIETSQELLVSVENSAPSQVVENIPGAKRGLSGMRERVDLYHGSLHYGPTASGGFKVFATLPKKDS